MLLDGALRCSPKAVQYSRPGKNFEAAKETQCIHYSKKIFEFGIKFKFGIKRYEKFDWH